MTRVAVVGATGALGQEIMSVLHRAPWKPEQVTPLASPASKVPFVKFGEEQLAVDNVLDESFVDTDVVFIATPTEFAEPFIDDAVGEGAIVVDCSGVSEADDDVPVIVPWINPERLAEFPLRGVVALPSADAFLVASILGPLQRVGIVGQFQATVFRPASIQGRDGIDELSRQVTAMFNSAPAPRKVFSQGLAFDIEPVVGAVQQSGFTDVEERVRRQVRGLIPQEVSGSVTVVSVPVFSGLSAQIFVSCPTPVAVASVREALSAGGVKVADSPRDTPRPRRVESYPFAQAGRIRWDDDLRGFHIWASFDNLVGMAAAAVACAGALLKVQGDNS